MAKESYSGKIKNNGNQEVGALYRTSGNKSGSVKRGKDLRVKGK